MQVYRHKMPFKSHYDLIVDHCTDRREKDCGSAEEAHNWFINNTVSTKKYKKKKWLKGVYWDKSRQQWKVQYWDDKIINVGRYDTKQEAEKVWQKTKIQNGIPT